MRQAGILTSAARVALNEHFHKLPYTHELAQWLGDEASKLGAEILKPVDTSMVSLLDDVCKMIFDFDMSLFRSISMLDLLDSLQSSYDSEP